MGTSEGCKIQWDETVHDAQWALSQSELLMINNIIKQGSVAHMWVGLEEGGGGGRLEK